jgi:hypothetical protein
MSRTGLPGRDGQKRTAMIARAGQPVTDSHNLTLRMDRQTGDYKQEQLIACYESHFCLFVSSQTLQSIF